MNSKDMAIALPEDKRTNILTECKNLIENQNPTIRDVARVVGKLVASFPAVTHGPLYYRHLERDKMTALKSKRGNFNGKMKLSEGGFHELLWWTRFLKERTVPRPPAFIRTSVWVLSDASLSGWGGTRLSDGSHPDAVASGQWSVREREPRNINVLELKGALFTLKALCSDVFNETIDIRVDNMTTVAAVKKMGSKSRECDLVAREIWEWAIKANNFG